MSAISHAPVAVRPRPRPLDAPARVEVGEVVRPVVLRCRRLAVRRGTVSGGCARPTVLDARRSRHARLAEVQAVVFVVLVIVGLLIAVPKLLAMTQPDPSVDPVAGDPAWAHVTGR